MLSLQDAVKELGRDLVLKALKAELAKRDLAYFVEQTTRDTNGNPLKLHDWQRDHFIPLLGSKPAGRRVRFHAAPQYGKSIILSKRFPLWFLLNNPLARIVIVSYNEDFCQRFYDALKSSLFEVTQLFPKFTLTGNQSTGLKTGERSALNDGTSSVIFCSIATGFTGSGADVVVIDDPYRGLEDAQSLSYRSLVESFFENKLMPRINEETDIYLMYHAWAVGDIGDYAVSKYGFKPVRFAAIADGLGDDPTGREVGELLSPMRTREFLESIRTTDPRMFAAMYQGLPDEGEEFIFRDWMFEGRLVSPAVCPDLQFWFRGWDTATTNKQSSDGSATCKMAHDAEGNLWIRGFRGGRVNLANLTTWAYEIITAQDYETHTTQVIENAGGGAAVYGYLLAQDAWKSLAKSVTQTKDKRTRALPLASMARARKVFIVQEGDWEVFKHQLINFTGADGRPDDFVDAATTAQNFMVSEKTVSRPKEDKARYVSPGLVHIGNKRLLDS